MTVRGPKIAISGAGLAGLCLAHALVLRGAHPVLYDPAGPGKGASWAAAGMLAPAFEAGHDADGDADFAEMCRTAAAFWPEFASELERRSTIDVGYRSGPSWMVAPQGASPNDLSAAAARMQALGNRVETVEGAALRSGLPGLATDVDSALVLHGDGQVDNRAVLQALVRWLQDQGVVFHRMPRPSKRDWDVAVDAYGWQMPDIRPVKGIALALPPVPGQVNAPVRFGPSYIVPKSDRTVIGATVEPGCTSFDVPDDAVEDLYNAACQVCPVLANAPVMDRWSGIRPRAQTVQPELGWVSAAHYRLGGYYRNGVLLSPLMGVWAARHILEGHPPPNIEASRLMGPLGA